MNNDEVVKTVKLLLDQDKNGHHLSRNDILKAIDAVAVITAVLAKHSVNNEVEKLRS